MGLYTMMTKLTVLCLTVLAASAAGGFYSSPRIPDHVQVGSKIKLARPHIDTPRHQTPIVDAVVLELNRDFIRGDKFCTDEITVEYTQNRQLYTKMIFHRQFEDLVQWPNKE